MLTFDFLIFGMEVATSSFNLYFMQTNKQKVLVIMRHLCHTNFPPENACNPSEGYSRVLVLERKSL